MRRTDRSELDLSRLRGILGDDAFLYVNYPFCSKLCGFCIYKLHRYSEAASRRFLSGLEMEASLLADLLDGLPHPWITRQEVVIDHALGPNVAQVVGVQAEVGTSTVADSQRNI